MSLEHVLDRLIQGVNLTSDEAQALMSVLTEGEFVPEQVAGILVALQAKGATPVELAGMAGVLREKALKLSHDHPALVDTCGTGGGRPTFNLSTGAAIVAAAAGAKVAKHGNRSVTSKCGSADVLEALGVKIVADPERLGHLLEQVGIVFLFAQHHHGSMKAVGPVRRALGVRTVFNQLGPLANPAGAQRQLVGVYSRDMVAPMAEALALLGSERSYVVHGEDGMDEISPCAPTHFAEVIDGRVHEGVFEPADFGLEPLAESVLHPGANIAESGEILQRALSGGAPVSEALVPNAAVTLVLAGLARNVQQGAGLARQTMASGAATAVLARLVEATTA